MEELEEAHCGGGAAAAMELPLASAMASLTERERERMGESGEEVSVLYLSTVRRRAGGHASNEGATRPAAPEHRSATIHQFRISNSTSNIPLKPDVQPSIYPKSLSFGTIRSNQNCRATRHLQLFLKRQSLIQPGWRDTRLRSGVHETEISGFS